MLCVKCKADEAHRSHRRSLLERLAGVVAVYPYRCHTCNYRFLRFRYSAGVIAPAANSTEREVRATRSAVEWRRKRREVLLYGMGFLLFLAFLYFITRERGNSSDGG